MDAPDAQQLRRDLRSWSPDAAPDLLRQEVDWLQACWGQPHRCYHGPQHVAEMLAAIAAASSPTTTTDGATTNSATTDSATTDSAAPNSKGSPEVPAADDARVARVVAWYHDVHYDPRAAAGSNEHRSATLARDHLHRLGVPSSLVDRVDDLVLATADHLRADSSDPAWPLVRDADLWILRSPAARYRRYAEQVRREYQHVSDTDFRTGRGQILRTLLAADPLYLTEPAARTWTASARANLTWEIEHLAVGGVG